MNPFARFTPGVTIVGVTLALSALTACGAEPTPVDQAPQNTTAQLTEPSTPPPSGTTAAQSANNDGVLAAIQGTYIATLQKEVDGVTQSQPFQFTIGQRQLDGVNWPTLEVSSRGAIGTIEFGSYLAWELYGYGNNYALISPAMKQSAISEDYTLAFQLILNLQTQSSTSKLLVPTQSVILIKDCGFFENVFASCTNLLNGAELVENSFKKL
jgi:hypothetical protein